MMFNFAKNVLHKYQAIKHSCRGFCLGLVVVFKQPNYGKFLFLIQWNKGKSLLSEHSQWMEVTESPGLFFSFFLDICSWFFSGEDRLKLTGLISDTARGQNKK